MQLPEIWRYTALLAQRDQGMMLVLALVIISLALLVQARFLYQRWLPATCTILVGVFYLSLAAILVVQVFSA